MSRVKNKSFGFLNRLFIYNYLKLWKASLKPAATLDMSWQAKKMNPNPVIGNNKEQGWELAQQLRTLAAFSEGWSLVSSSHIRYLIITLYTSSKKSNLLFWLLGTSLNMFIYTHTYTCTHKPTHTWTNNVKKRKEKKKYESYVSALSSMVTVWFAYPPGIISLYWFCRRPLILLTGLTSSCRLLYSVVLWEWLDQNPWSPDTWTPRRSVLPVTSSCSNQWKVQHRATP